ncbi:MAG: hypothetical protein EHM27_12260 [Deltaproteobacteria bacterium]|nr:MAG: hypothetical protein EHM27_12260 [Deltaproteobacteria bacterium]
MSLSELTGTIKAGVCAQGVDVYRPRKPGSGVTPALGENTDQILRKFLSFSAEEIKILREKKII